MRHVRWRVVTTAVIVRTERLKGWGSCISEGVGVVPPMSQSNSHGPDVLYACAAQSVLFKASFLVGYARNDA